MVWDVVRDRVDLGEAGEVTREYVRHPGAVAVAALDDEGRLCLIQQYRHPVRTFEWEIPAGLLDVTGEPPARGRRPRAARGSRPRRRPPGTCSPTTSAHPAASTRRCASTSPVTSRPSPRPSATSSDGEELGMPVRWVPLEEVRDAVLAGRVHNATIAIAVLAALAARDLDWTTLRAHDAPWPSHPAYRASAGSRGVGP